MTVNDFEVGQTVCILFHKRYGNSEPSYKDTTVSKVGRKYVTTAYGDFQFEAHPNIDYALTEHIEWGHPLYLFPSRKDAEEHVERCDLTKWLSEVTRNTYRLRYSLDQLRRVKAILTEGDAT